MRIVSVLTVFIGLLAFPLPAAEIAFDFGQFPEGKTPPGFRSALSGTGKAPDWRIVTDEVPPALAPLTPQAPSVTRRAVLAQLSEDLTDEHFPMLIYEKEIFRDFEFTTRFKTVRGVQEQMAGLAFRIQNETNYYVVRASALGNTFRFYKVVNGQRGEVIGPEIKIPTGVWNEMSVRCKGNEIRCSLNGKEVIPPLQDNTFPNGKIGFWTKSDSVTYFLDAKVTYTPREVPAQVLVRQLLEQYNKLLGLQIYVPGSNPSSTRLIASGLPDEVGKSGGNPEWDVIQRGVKYYGKQKGSVLVTLPLRDKNGEPIAAVKVIMKTFPGQTEKNALERAMPIMQYLQRQVINKEDLIEE
jgi:hypothetical protein